MARSPSDRLPGLAQCFAACSGVCHGSLGTSVDARRVHSGIT